MAISLLVFDGIVMAAEQKRPTLDSCLCHSRCGTTCFEQVFQWLVVRQDDKVATKQMLMKSLDAKHNGKTFFKLRIVLCWCQGA